jgi:hypothetical protein
VTTLGLTVLALSIAACGVVDPADPPSIAGRYDLVAVNDAVLPCCAQVDSTGTRVTFVGGSLTLDAASPEPFVATPAGELPKSCVFAIPNGAHVDTSGVVTLPDSTKYRLPRCPELHHAAYTLVITRRYDDPAGGSQTLSATASGTYAWTEAGDHAGLIALLNGNLTGAVTHSPGGVEVLVGQSHFGRGPALTPSDPEYRFLRSVQDQR